jgi:hypothetical protein
MVCCAAAELEAQLGIAEKTLAEFIIDVAKGSRNVDGFKKVRCYVAVSKRASAQTTAAEAAGTPQRSCSSVYEKCSHASGGVHALRQHTWSLFLQHLFEITCSITGHAANTAQPSCRVRCGLTLRPSCKQSCAAPAVQIY